MKYSLLALVLVLASPASADIRAQADALIEQSLQEHIVIANCIEQEGETLDIMRDILPGNFSSAAPEMRELGYSEAEIQELIERTSFENLLLPADTPVGDVRALCAENYGWRRQHQFMENILLRSELRKLVDAQ